MSKPTKEWLFAALPFVVNHSYEKNYGVPNPYPFEKLPKIHSEFDGIYLKEKDFSSKMKEKAVPYLKKRESIGYLKGPSALRVAIYRADQPRATVAICHGMGECIERYQEFIYYLLQMNFDVFMVEHFGHGKSSRKPSDEHLVWVDHFNRYSRDYQAFIQKVVSPKLRTRPLIHFAHSMGGPILANTMNQYGVTGDAVIYCSPMFRLLFGPLERILYPLSQFHSKPKAGKVPVCGVFPRTLVNLFPPVPATHSRARIEYFKEILNYVPPIVSWTWLFESIKVTHEVMKKKNIEKLNVPTLLFSASRDLYVSTVGHWLFARDHKDCQPYLVPRSFHEIYSESDDIIPDFFNTLEAFVSKIIMKTQN